MEVLAQIVAASLACGLLSMIGAALVTFGLPRRWLTGLVSFSAGILLTTALLEALPEALAYGLSAQSLFYWLLAGLLGFFALERFVNERIAHDRHSDTRSAAATARMIIIGDGVHNITDGVVLAAAFLVDAHLGWMTALAIIAHEVPQEVGDFALLLTAGWSKAKAFVWNGISSLTSVAGGVAGYFWLEGARAWVPQVLVIAAASFIYVAVSYLMPRLRRERGAFFWQSGCMAAGVATVPIALTYLH